MHLWGFMDKLPTGLWHNVHRGTSHGDISSGWQKSRGIFTGVVGGAVCFGVGVGGFGGAGVAADYCGPDDSAWVDAGRGARAGDSSANFQASQEQSSEAIAGGI